MRGEQRINDYTIEFDIAPGIEGIDNVRQFIEAYESQEIKIKQFDLNNIDTMRENILKHPGGTPLEIGQDYNLVPYSDVLKNLAGSTRICSIYSQEGLALKTYQSDIFNNWLSTEWIDGTTGINAITAVSTTGDKFSIDQLNLAQKVYDMLNRIAVSGGIVS